MFAEQGSGAEPFEHAGGCRLVDGRECHLDVAQYLGGGAAHADEHGRPEARIPAGADDQLDTALQVGHLLDRERRGIELFDEPGMRVEKRFA